MKGIRIAAGVALALAATAAMAVSGDTWHGTSRYLVTAPDPVVVMRVVPDSELVYRYPQGDFVIERHVGAPMVAPVLVERVYEVPAREYVYRRYDPVAAANPQTGPHIGNGLFPRPGEGPNDFGR
jgi:hypothetical protein